MKDSKTQKYREYAGQNGITKPITRDRYSKFMAAKEQQKGRELREDRKKEWLKRFKDRREWHTMDKNNKTIYLKTMTQSTHGTKAELQTSDLINALAQIAEDEETLKTFKQRLEEQYNKKA